LNITVDLLQCTPLDILIRAIRTCYESHDNSDSSWCISKDLKSYNTKYFELGEKDKNLIKRIIDSQHTSTLEHIVFTFDIKGISRLCLQELSRHRIASPSVKSSRYTLKELKKEKEFWYPNLQTFSNFYDWERASKYINFIDVEEIDIASIQALENVRKLIVSGKYSNDKIKYCLPEGFKVNEVLTINLRSLINFLHLREAEGAHFEIRDLAGKMRNIIPKEYHFILS